MLCVPSAVATSSRTPEPPWVGDTERTAAPTTSLMPSSSRTRLGGCRDVAVLPREKLAPPLDYRDLAPEPAEHLPELDSYVPATQHHHALRNGVELHDGGRRRDRGRNRARARWGMAGRHPVLMKIRSASMTTRSRLLGLSEGAAKPVRPSPAGRNSRVCGPDETRLRHDQRSRFSVRRESPLAAAPPAFDDVPLALPHRRHIHRHLAGNDPVAPAARRARYATRARRDHDLGGRASLVDAGTPDMLTLDERRPPPRAGESSWPAVPRPALRR